MAIRLTDSTRVRRSFAAADDSEPVPDVLVLPSRDYGAAHPDEALLAIEVSDSSLHRDRTIKRDLYAVAGIPEYWVVNLTADAVEVYADPAEGRYRHVRTVEPGSSISLVSFPDVAISVGDLLG